MSPSSLEKQGLKGNSRALRKCSIKCDPRASQRILDAAVAGFDHVSRDGTDKGVERSRADRVHHALADPFRIETGLRETLGKYRLVAGADLRPTHVVRAITSAARDIRVDRAGAQHRDAH